MKQTPWQLEEDDMTRVLELLGLSLIAGAFVIDVKLGLLGLLALFLAVKFVSDYRSHQRPPERRSKTENGRANDSENDSFY